MTPHEDSPPASGLILYRTEDAHTRIEVRLEGGTVWLTQAQMAELYQVSPKTISEHLQNIFAEGECKPERTIRNFRTVRQEAQRQVRRDLDHYNLDAILAVGYRVRGPRGTQFRQWATQRLHEYLVKGFALDDERLKRGPDDGYFEELLARIRDIRSSERVFWRKVLDIYATSVDYDARAEASQRFFQIVQNKMHWAAHGHTAAEVIRARANAGRPNMGLTSWSAARPRRQDVTVAKNYLDADELEALNRIVTAYLEFAELQALNRRPMAMADWIAKLDEFLRLGERGILTHAGTVSHEAAVAQAQAEFDAFHREQLAQAAALEHELETTAKQVKRMAATKRKPAAKKASGKTKGKP